LRLAMRGGSGDPNINHFTTNEHKAAVKKQLEPPAPVVWMQLRHRVAKDEGTDVDPPSVWAGIETCQKMCEDNPECKSFSSCDLDGTDMKQCWFKDKALTGHEPNVPNERCSENYLGNEYIPSDSALEAPSPSPPITFYMYRAQSDGPFYPAANVNMATIGGVMWYLHNEVIFTCDGAGFLAEGGALGDRKFQIDRIRRLKVTMKPTIPLLNKGMHFSVLEAFDSGEATGPHVGTWQDGPRSGWDSTGSWDEYGFTVGCGNLGEWPHADNIFATARNYPNAAWFSFPGACPQMNYKEATQSCDIAYPGGMCDDVTGQGNCTYSAEEAGYIMIDELVGITPAWSSRRQFCSDCNTEGGNNWGGGCGMNWWGPNVNDAAGNAERVKKVLQKFHDKYPNMPTEYDLPPPPCDFNRDAFGFAPDHP